MKQLYATLIILLSTVMLQSFAADVKYVRGRILDENDKPLAGATIIIKGNTSVGVSSDMKGDFSIPVREKGDTIVISFLGLETQKIGVSHATPFLTIKMKSAATNVSEVVITGYAQTTMKKVTGSVGVLTSEDLANKPQPSVDALLQGKLAGVAVTATSGQPGRKQTIRIRGTNTLTGNNDPLWVVDGVPLQDASSTLSSSQIKTGAFDDIFTNGVGGINPNDIENITVLKDASAAAIYGSRAAGGVIVVTTKRGKEGPLRINYSSNVSVTLKPERDGNLMNSAEKLAWEDQLWDEFSAAKYASGNKIYPVVGIVGMIRESKEGGPFASMRGNRAAQDAYIAQLGGQTTDWFDQIFRNSVSTNHHLSLSGGSNKFSYYTSLGYTYQNGLLLNDKYNRYNFTTNLDIKPNRSVKISFGYDMSQQNSSAPALTYVDPFEYAYFANPYEKPFNEDGSYSADRTYFSLGENNGNTIYKLPKDGYNIMRELDHTSSKTVNFANTIRGGLNVNILPKLRFDGLLSYSFSNNKTDQILQEDTYAAYMDRISFDLTNQDKLYGSITQNSINTSSYIARGHFAYDNTFGIHTISVLAGAEVRGATSKSLTAKRYGYDPVTGNATTPLPTLPDGSLNAGLFETYAKEMDSFNGAYKSESRFASFYASADYYLLNRYVFNFSFRTDGSSNFGSKEQFNPTWSAGMAWHIAEEKFMRSVNHVLNRLTLRLATGFTGNVSNGISPVMVMQYSDNYRVNGSQTYRMGSIVGAPNPALRWEKTQDIKAGLDFGLFDNRLNGVVEGYYRKSFDVVVSSQVLSTTGYYNQNYNSADIKNTGIEVTLNGTPIQTKNFSLFLSANIAYNTNKVTKYKPVSGKLSQYDSYWEGYPVDCIFGGRVIGINPTTGLYEYELRPDAEIRTQTDYNKPDNYRFYLGTSIAPITGGFNVTASYRTLRLSVSGVYSLKSKIVETLQSPATWQAPLRNTSSSDPNEQVSRESVQTYYNDLYANHLNVRRDATNRWTESNPTGTLYPRIYDAYDLKYYFAYTNPMDSQITRGAYLANTSYLRIKTIMLSYSMPKKIIAKAKMLDLSFNLSLNNFFTFTKYKGLDPETPSSTYPISRSVTFGVNIGF